MDKSFKTFFGMKNEPFRADLKQNEILETEELKSVKSKFYYATDLGGTALVTGDIGSGKSTALRYAADSLHPSEYKVFNITATSGPILELYHQIITEMCIGITGRSKALMIRLIKKEVMELVDTKKMKVVLIIDEASLLRMEVLAELHTLTQYHRDSKHWMPMVLSGQPNLIDKMMYRSSAPLASRVVARSHLEGLDREGMKNYIDHHLKLAGVKPGVFDDAAVTAVHQGSGGFLRKANHLARGALIAAAKQNEQIINPEHVRLAATEIF
jgi:type II secretory pathway predicted ATPase ExeA